MKRLFYISIFLFVPFIISAQPDSIDCSTAFIHDWVEINGDIDDDGVNCVVSDNDNNVIVAGYFRGTMVFQTETVVSSGGQDFFVAKLDQDGNLIWIKTGGAEQDDYATGVTVDSDGRISVLGSYRGLVNFNGTNHNATGLRDIFLIQYAPDGTYIWDAFPGGFNDDIAAGITTDAENNVIISGTYNQYIGIGSGTMIGLGGDDFFVAKYEQDGTYLWRINDGSTLNDSGTAVACDPNGNVFVCGEFAGTIDFGSATLTAVGAKDLFIAKYDKNGTFKWAKKAGTAGDNDKAGSVAADMFGNAYFLYKNDQIADMARVEKYNSNGTSIMNIGFGSAGNIFPKDIVVDNSQNVYVSGMYSGTADFGDGAVSVVGGQDYFVAKFKQNGAFSHKDIAGSIYVDCANSIYLDSQNSLIAGGFCNNGIFFGSTPYTATGKEDALIVKYDYSFSFDEFVVNSIDCDPNNMCVEINVIEGLAPFAYYIDGNLVDQTSCGYSIGDHQVIVVDENNCYIATTVTLIAPVGPEIPLPANRQICPFDTVTLDAGAGNYSWEWGAGEDTQTIEVSDAGVYSVTVTDNETGCFDEASITITERPNKDLLPDTDSLCIGSELTITTYDIYTGYQWSDGTATANFTSGADGNHWVRVYEAFTQCWYYDTIKFVHYAKPLVNIGNDQTICDGDSVLISIEEISANTVSYLWSTGDNGTSIWASSEGIYSITITDINECQDYDTVYVGYAESPIIELGDDFILCTSVPVILDPNDDGTDNTYLWNNNSTAGTLATSNSGQYWVRVSGPSGCASSDTINIILYPQPNLNLGQDIEFCNGESDLIEISGTYETYQWSNGATTSSLVVIQTEDISVTVTDANGCSDADTISIIEHDIVDPFIGYDTTLCTGESHILRTSEDYHRYRWHNNSTAPTFTVTQPGTYAVTVYDDINCSASTSIEIDYQDGPQLITASAGGGIIRVNATGGTPPLIYSHDGDTWQTSNVFIGLESDTYTISIMDENYCMITVDVYLDQSLQIPDFFTPNGDGYNDTWVITGLYHYPGATVEVFDRYGKKLFHSDGAQFSWNGIYAGLHLPSDTYWYVITLTEGLEPLKGSVTIKR